MTNLCRFETASVVAQTTCQCTCCYLKHRKSSDQAVILGNITLEPTRGALYKRSTSGVEVSISVCHSGGLGLKQVMAGVVYLV